MVDHLFKVFRAGIERRHRRIDDRAHFGGRRHRTQMAEVERGRLDGHAPVVSTDEIGAVAEGFNRMLHGLRERELVKETFGKYVTPEIRDEILAGRISGDGELKEVTVLFADIRDFTPWVEATAPRDVVRDLNEYFTEMAEAIRAQRGLVLQFIGDEIEAGQCLRSVPGLHVERHRLVVPAGAAFNTAIAFSE